MQREQQQFSQACCDVCVEGVGRRRPVGQKDETVRSRSYFVTVVLVNPI
jgi:hypothetical protein